jgi:hypothetical protein
MPRAVENSKPNQQFIASCRRSPVLRESSSHQTLCWRKPDSNHRFRPQRWEFRNEVLFLRVERV